MKDKLGLILTLLALWFMASITLADAATYYVGPGGNALCNGTKDVPFSVNDNVNCRFNHPFKALGPNGGGVLKGGDTLQIEGTYNMGFGGMSGLPCNPQEAYNCYMRPIPSGTDAQPTKIISVNGAKLVGVERAFTVLNFQGSNNVRVENIEVTDGSACQETGPAACQRDTPPYGAWAKTGLYLVDATNIYLKNVNTHGMAYKGAWMARAKNITFDGGRIWNNSFVGIDGDLGPGTNSSNPGPISFINGFSLKGSGCAEKLDGTRYNCYSQDQLGGYGDGYGAGPTGGDYICRDSEFSENVSDGFDLLYHNGQGKITIQNCKFENNSGNQIKINLKVATIENSTITGDCFWYRDHPQYLWQASSYNNCRADGDALAVSLGVGYQISITNTQFKKIRHWGILATGKNCDGSTKLTIDDKTPGKGTTFELLPKYNTPSEMSKPYYSDGDSGGGSCKSITPISVDGAQPPTDTTPPTILNLTATPSDTTATIVWELSENATGQIAYGLTSNYNIFSDPETSFTYARHVQTLANLTKATTYHYQIKSKDQAGNEVKSVDKTFTTTGATACVPDHSCDNVACGKTCVDNCGTIIAGKPCPAGSCTITVPVPCDQVKIGP